MATYTYAAYAKVLRLEVRTMEGHVETIRRTVKERAPGIIQAEIASLNRPPVDRGDYKRSWKTMNVPGGVRVYSTSPYAAIIERGRRPGAKMPPLQVIIAWLARKGIVKGAGSRSFATESQYARLRSAAFVIARAIARRGLPARMVLALASKKIDLAVRQELARGAGLAAPEV